MQIIKDSLKTIALSLIVLSLISIAYAWTEPIATPPNENTKAPINESRTGQIKYGGLWVGSDADAITIGGGNGLIVENGNVGIGTTTPGQKLSVAGIVESTSGGIKFPDGTIQTTAAEITQTTAIGGVPNGFVAFTSSGSWTAPSGITRIYVVVRGGGGSGAGASAGGAGGGGGGANANFINVIPGANYAITVGVGGAGSYYNGSKGGNSSFGNIITAGGGSGGSGAGGGAGGAGGGYGGAGGGGGPGIYDKQEIPVLISGGYGGGGGSYPGFSIGGTLIIPTSNGGGGGYSKAYYSMGNPGSPGGILIIY